MRTLAALAFVAAIMSCPPSFASETTTPTPSPSATTTATPTSGVHGGFNVVGETEGGSESDPGTQATGNSSEGQDPEPLAPGQWVKTGACDTMGAGGCHDLITCADGSPAIGWEYIRASDGVVILTTDLCPGEQPPAPEATPPVDIPGEVLKAFEKVELPASTISIQPPGGQTLVNFKTILSTPATQHQVTVHLDKVNIDVVLELTPSHFLWKHGDGTGQESTITGAVWSEGANVDGEDFITHVYTKKLTAAQVSVDTTWSARFKGPKDTDWRPVDGTVTKVGEPVSLAVREATPQLVTAPN